MTSLSRGRHLALGSGGPGFKSWLCQIDVDSLEKALYMHFLTPLMFKNENLAIGSILEWRVTCNDSSSGNAPHGVEKGSVVGMACRGPLVKRLEHFFWNKRYINALFNLILDECTTFCFLYLLLKCSRWNIKGKLFHTRFLYQSAGEGPQRPAATEIKNILRWWHRARQAWEVTEAFWYILYMFIAISLEVDKKGNHQEAQSFESKGLEWRYQYLEGFSIFF